ncbi:hypothetical protein EGT74_13620 [Chitinophaga lutea]|uniref:Outer membrane protein beta-barrel domain-containing protein n=1 Tax=Chitinophaga lutea TaxID=2488634 RepID=A0A3N4PHC4_9BACT|nr:hypothetical protein [Chitinophaga lutea]RPE08102.1 hypothetical protein EGT74_13620 [Chitinophaga lutea]
MNANIRKGTFPNRLRKGILTGILTGISFTGAHAQHTAPAYPKIGAYVGILHPVVTFGSDVPHYNFDGVYTVGLPTGINIWKSPRIGFSMEFVPTVRVTSGTNKMNNFLFHPGALFGLGKGFTLAARAAFETSGRYGFTPVLNKVVYKGKHTGYFVAVPVPVRFGNDQPGTVGAGFQFGIVF